MALTRWEIFYICDCLYDKYTLNHFSFSSSSFKSNNGDIIDSIVTTNNTNTTTITKVEKIKAATIRFPKAIIMTVKEINDHSKNNDIYLYSDCRARETLAWRRDL
ncbi:hypothetical protein Glove_13g192 [Diversispora epigaea]|uniref:Uncharacterized protein n=1 Tax=Diversispora epigaea TaxID=1348612 RepID=A0A397JNS2_9GLOM|nr:hypothetical protein Glove_13g192 [Diversispora epigaea]